MSLAWPAARGTSLAPARVVVQRQVHWRRNTIERPARGRLACGRLQLHASFQVLRRRQMQRPNSHTHVATAQLAATDASAQGGKQETAPVTIELRPGETIYFACEHHITHAINGRSTFTTDSAQHLGGSLAPTCHA